MIIFEHGKYLQNIKKNGIGATDPNAKFKIDYLMTDYVLNSAYRKNKIIQLVKNTASQYFYGLPDELIFKELELFYEDARKKVSNWDFAYEHQNKVITLYESEMKTIAHLKDDRLMRLAFATLILHKFTGQHIVNGNVKYYQSVKACEADIYRVAEFGNLSGITKDKLWKTLSDKGLVRYYIKTNQSWSFYPNSIEMTLFKVPFNVDIKDDKTNEKIYKQITNYDDVLSYLKFYLGDKNLIECEDCGCPIIKSKCLCSNCAAARKKASDKARYERKIAIA